MDVVANAVDSNAQLVERARRHGLSLDLPVVYLHLLSLATYGRDANDTARVSWMNESTVEVQRFRRTRLADHTFKAPDAAEIVRV